MAKLSEHFDLDEMTFSDFAARHELDNTPDEAVTANLTRLCNDLMEPIRELLGNYPLHVNSGYRSPAVNVGVGGVLPGPGKRGSQHLYGEACDFKLTKSGAVQDLVDAFNKIKNSDLPYHQLIFEANSWIHVSVSPEGEQAKRQALRAVRENGSWKYYEVDGDLNV